MWHSHERGEKRRSHPISERVLRARVAARYQMIKELRREYPCGLATCHRLLTRNCSGGNRERHERGVRHQPHRAFRAGRLRPPQRQRRRVTEARRLASASLPALRQHRLQYGSGLFSKPTWEALMLPITRGRPIVPISAFQSRRAARSISGRRERPEARRVCRNKSLGERGFGKQAATGERDGATVSPLSCR